jgi:hypothetical protein
VPIGKGKKPRGNWVFDFFFYFTIFCVCAALVVGTILMVMFDQGVR